ncbi:tryptophan 2,3-dioxygenase [Panacibacter ginsenosidivorans]|uniref:Tryptophan 2,3-dioxygenase n=1 Tax=Panacibacter ginsenosidivorans TaxID=1813871 RepID=A0A5B8VCG2_9BACT|nr:tryptophan 2,3-dioxygenase family protein [Panacibacter ginsenosidivorans]QEC68693.1 tryptophan 2,3-dioxygenase [Panacibacter ginsenosidivorans]
MKNTNVYYQDYLQLNNILNSQHPESFKEGNEKAHDEMLFIVIHQAYELWFKQLLFEVSSAIEVMSQQSINDNTPQLQTVVHRLNRVVTILKVLVHQIDIMETMTPMDFLEFRDLLRPASGFQSWQFKALEARLGLEYAERYGKEYYTSQLKQPEIDIIKTAESEKSLLHVVNKWLERMPYFDNIDHWKDFANESNEANIHPYWSTYRMRYSNSLAEAERNNMNAFDKIFIEGKEGGQLSAKARRAALFIMLYRGYPILHLPFELLNNLLEIDEQMSTWRYRHMNMVHRMIGTRIGTGGSTGKDYLKAALDKHYIFKEIAQLTSFLIERSKLPALPASLIQHLSFNM